ncbi:uncharacterized protein AAEQ78_025995 isoform 1-T1 [Lycaon pictus]
MQGARRGTRSRVSRITSRPKAEASLNLSLILKEEMKNTSWIRKNWLLVAGVSFIGVHLGTYFIQRAAKESVKSQSRGKQQSIGE